MTDRSATPVSMLPETLDAPAETSAPARSGWRRIPTDVWVAILVIGMFAMLQNPFWSAGGDSEVYLDMARNIARGGGYKFNHQPVSEVTPLWPIVLGAAMRISASFAFLKLVSMLFMAAGMMIWYR